MKNLKPILVLVLISLSAALLLALTNSFTAPEIAKEEKRKEEEALALVLPSATGFDTVEIPENAPATVTAVYRAKNGTGYAVRIETSGFSGGLKLLFGIDGSGRLAGLSTLATNETDGYGKKCAESGYSSQYIGKDASLSGIDAVSGATKSSKAYENAARDAFAVYELLTKGGSER